MSVWPPGTGEIATRIRGRDWADTPLGPIGVWSERLRLMVEQVLASPLVASLVCGPKRVLIYNDAASRLYGNQHPAALGRPLQESFPDDYPTVAHLYDRAFAGEPVHVPAQPLDVSEAGGEVFDAYLTPVRDAEGQVFAVHMVGFEISGQLRAEEALRESEARLAASFESIPAGIAVVDVTGASVIANSAYRRLLPGGVIPSRDPERAGRWRAWDQEGHPIDPQSYPGARALRGERVVPGEEMLHTDDEGRETWTRVGTVPVLDAAGQVTGIVTVISDINDLKQSAVALRESEERQAFLLRLSDALRAVTDPIEIEGTACRLLGEHLRIERAYFVEISEVRGVAAVTRDFVQGDAPSLAGKHPIASFSWSVEILRRGACHVVSDTQTSPVVPQADRAALAALQIAACMGAPLIKDGTLVGALCVTASRPRPWGETEVELLREVGERIWSAIERARAEAALRESEERFQQFARASSAGLWIRNAETLAMEFASPAVGAIYGAGQDALLGDVKHWATMIVPEDREAALAHLAVGRQGKVITQEFRVRRASDGAFRWIRDTGFPLRDDGHIPRLGGIAEDITETRRLREHQAVLLAELQHRVRNIMGMIRSVANRTAAGALDVKDYRTLLEGRLLALARVQALLKREVNSGGSLRSIIESEVAAQAHHGGQFVLTGPDIRLSPKAVEVLTLAFHELATNALKYGALSVAEGRLSVRWTPIEKRGAPWLSLDWIEEGAPPREPSTRRGFGSELIEARIPYELGGRGWITLRENGAQCHLEFPLRDGESTLETDAPQLATIFGGTLDMTGAPDLTGRRVLVVDDDYYMASDTAAALRGAGATVLGPCPNEEATRDLLEGETPTHAVLDLNLGGGGPRFGIAHLLKARGVPFLFLTGYDPDVIPKDMEDVVRLQKPLPFRAIVEAVSAM